MKSCITVLFALLCAAAFGQTTPQDQLAKGYYVVVASYLGSQENYAKLYADKVNQDGKHAGFGFDPVRKFYHVYLYKYSDFNESIRQMQRARSAGYPTAWVRIIKGAMTDTQPEKNIVQPGVVTIADEPAKVPVVKDPEPAQNIKTPAPPSQPAPPSSPAPPAPPTPPAVKEDVVAVKTAPPAEVMAPAVTAPVTNPPAVEAPAKEEMPVISNKQATFSAKLLTEGTVMLAVFNATDNKELEGTVEIVDAERSKLLNKAKGNELVTLPDPKTKSGNLVMIATSFGFRPTQHELNYKSADKDTVPNFIDIVDNHYRIRFEMVKLRRGDITVLYNVYFYNDAAIMLPESKYELNKLLNMLRDNTGYRIKLHGHTNGNGSGKIITMGKSKDFFTLNSETNSGFGSAKELSKDRAQVIKDWLVANGIDEKRVEVQAHGGNRMIHDKNSANAKKNVRVEVEMLSE